MVGPNTRCDDSCRMFGLFLGALTMSGFDLGNTNSADAINTITAAKPARPANRELVSIALRLLAMREMSRAQFVEKLTAREFSGEETAEAVAWCTAEGWLNDTRFASVTARRLSQKYGSTRVARTLKQKGVHSDAVIDAIAVLQETELMRARAVWARKFAALPTSADRRAKQVRYLQVRGFSFAVIKQVLSGVTDDT
jgi:regulatory protein